MIRNETCKYSPRSALPSLWRVTYVVGPVKYVYLVTAVDEINADLIVTNNEGLEEFDNKTIELIRKGYDGPYRESV